MFSSSISAAPCWASFSTYYLPDNTLNRINVNSYAMDFKHEVCKAAVEEEEEEEEEERA